MSEPILYVLPSQLQQCPWTSYLVRLLSFSSQPQYCTSSDQCLSPYPRTALSRAQRRQAPYGTPATGRPPQPHSRTPPHSWSTSVLHQAGKKLRAQVSNRPASLPSSNHSPSPRPPSFPGIIKCTAHEPICFRKKRSTRPLNHSTLSGFAKTLQKSASNLLLSLSRPQTPRVVERLHRRLQSKRRCVMAIVNHHGRATRPRSGRNHSRRRRPSSR